MRCPKCGAIMGQVVCDVDGKQYYECCRPLHGLKVNLASNRVEFEGNSRLCETVVDQKGRPFSGFVAFVRGGQVVSEKL